MTSQEQEKFVVYDAVGGGEFFDELVERFYKEVESNDLLRPLYPDDLGPPKARLAGFLSQYWGGPSDYSKTRGHPRLRMRHAPYTISIYERDAWMTCMRLALEAMEMPKNIKDIMFDYFENAATHLINSTHQPTGCGIPIQVR